MWYVATLLMLVRDAFTIIIMVNSPAQANTFHAKVLRSQCNLITSILDTQPPSVTLQLPLYSSLAALS